MAYKIKVFNEDYYGKTSNVWYGSKGILSGDVSYLDILLMQNYWNTSKPAKTEKKITDRTIRRKKNKIREELEQVEFILPTPKMVTEIDLMDKILYIINNFKETETPNGVVIDKLSLRIHQKYISSTNLGTIEGITLVNRGNWCFIHIHSELLQQNVKIGHIIYIVLLILNKLGVFNYELRGKIYDMKYSLSSVRSLLYNYFLFSGYEVAFDFDVPVGLLINESEWSNYKTSYYSKDLRTSKQMTSSGIKRFRTNKSLLCIYDRGKKIDSMSQLSRFEIRMESKYIRDNRFRSSELFYWDFINKSPISLACLNRVSLAKAVETAIRLDKDNYPNQLYKIYQLIDGQKEYDLLKWIIKYAVPEIAYKY